MWESPPTLFNSPSASKRDRSSRSGKTVITPRNKIRLVFGGPDKSPFALSRLDHRWAVRFLIFSHSVERPDR
jgi:hypothetical protein